MKLLKRINHFVYSLHRILGTLLSAVFVMWFVSAFVMMYHGFPQVSQKDIMEKREPLTTCESLPPIDSLLTHLPVGAPVMRTSVERWMGETQFTFQTPDATVVLNPQGEAVSNEVTEETIAQTVAFWCNAPISRVDTLNKLDQWIPFGRNKREFPIYKYYFADDERHQLYIGSHTGKVLQFTSHSERVWAWLGAIPHWIYFTFIREDGELWTKVVVWLSGIGTVMTLIGLWIGIDICIKTRKAKKRRLLGSPYRKKWYHWHYVTGIVFGIFTLAFVFSGLMSMIDVPAWISKPTVRVNPMRAFHEPAPALNAYQLDYRDAIAAHPEARRLEWSNFRNHPYYSLSGVRFEEVVDAADSVAKPLALTQDEVRTAIEEAYAREPEGSYHIEMELMEDFDAYYRDMGRMYAGRKFLPVWKVTMNDADNSVFYVNPATAMVRSENNTSRIKYWTYTALHRMRLPGLNSNTTLRKTVLWILLLGGTVTSLSGVVLGCNYIIRKCRRKKVK